VPVLFSPSFDQVAPRDLARWLLESGRPARLQLQLHKLIWGAEARGV
jgi:7-carboxy-7-deazaguanine synthase